MKNYNRSAIMRRAWELYRTSRAIYRAFSEALKSSWSRAKNEMICEIQKAKIVAQKAMMNTDETISSIDNAIFNLNMKDRWTNEDYEMDIKLRERRRQLTSAQDVTVAA